MVCTKIGVVKRRERLRKSVRKYGVPGRETGRLWTSRYRTLRYDDTCSQTWAPLRPFHGCELLPRPTGNRHIHRHEGRRLDLPAVRRAPIHGRKIEFAAAKSQTTDGGLARGRLPLASCSRARNGQTVLLGLAIKQSQKSK